MRRRTLYKAERVGDEFIFATDPRHSKYEQAKREREARELDPNEVMTRATALALIEEAGRWQKAYAEARDALLGERDLIEAGTTLADIAARACIEPRRFHESEGHQQALSLAVARWRSLAASVCMCLTTEREWRPCPESLCERPDHSHVVAESAQVHSPKIVGCTITNSPENYGIDVSERCPGCGGDASDSSFDRSLCACGSMHYYCCGCGSQLDPCR